MTYNIWICRIYFRAEEPFIALTSEKWHGRSIDYIREIEWEDWLLGKEGRIYQKRVSLWMPKGLADKFEEHCFTFSGGEKKMGDRLIKARILEALQQQGPFDISIKIPKKQRKTFPNISINNLVIGERENPYALGEIGNYTAKYSGIAESISTSYGVVVDTEWRGGKIKTRVFPKKPE